MLVNPGLDYSDYIELSNDSTIDAINQLEILQNNQDTFLLQQEINIWNAFKEYTTNINNIKQTILPDIHNIKGFWYNTLLHAGVFKHFPANQNDVKILQYLSNISCHSISQHVVPFPDSVNKKTLLTSFTLSFTFLDNPFLLNTVLTKNSPVFFATNKDPHLLNGVRIGSFFDFYYEMNEQITLDFSVSEVIAEQVIGSCINCYLNEQNIVIN
ncbi:Nucleosome assembly protein [Entamoeba marina]